MFICLHKIANIWEMYHFRQMALKYKERYARLKKITSAPGTTRPACYIYFTILAEILRKSPSSVPVS